MWIRTQDRKNLVNIIRFKISPVFGDKTKKVCISGEYSTSRLFGNNSVLLGHYDSLDAAMKEIDAIEYYIVDNPNKVYQMR